MTSSAAETETLKSCAVVRRPEGRNYNESKQKEKKQKKGEKAGLIQRGYYLTPGVAAQVKINAAMTGRRDYQVVQEALELYFKNNPTK